MNKRKVYPGYFVLGALTIYLVFMVIPGLIGIGFSFTDWSAYTDELNFVGWENFKTIFSPEENYVKVISNTLVFTFVTTIIKNVWVIAGAAINQAYAPFELPPRRYVYAVRPLYTNCRHGVHLYFKPC